MCKTEHFDGESIDANNQSLISDRKVANSTVRADDSLDCVDQSKSDLVDENQKVDKVGQSDWIMLSASVAGLFHTRPVPPIPCQDNYYILDLGDDWGVAVVCDGAGSCPLSHHGSEFVSRILADYLKQVVDYYQWKSKKELPDEVQWHKIAKSVFRQVRTDLERYCHKQNFGSNCEVLSCTAIVLVYSPIGVMLSHIGDGRACYCDCDGNWHALMTPFEGDNGGTVFVTTDYIWVKADAFINSKIVNMPIKAFSLLTDGCQDYVYESLKYDEEKNIYIDINKPYQPFFDSICRNAIERLEMGCSIQELNDDFIELLTSGRGFDQEMDDKTMVLGIFQDYT